MASSIFDFGLAAINSSLPPNHTRKSIPGGSLGTSATIQFMRRGVTQGKRDFRVRKFAIQLIQGCPPKDYECFARKIFDYCQNQVRYVFDPNGVELVESPWDVIEAGGADCDSIVVLLAALLESVGLPCEFVTIKADVSRPDEFSHVYLECKIPRQGWVGMDATMHDHPFGWKPAPGAPRKRWTASNDAPESHDGDTMAGLGEDVPHTEHTRGVIVGSDWNFRPEAALITSAPEEIELDSFEPEYLPAQISERQEEFLTASQLEDMQFPEPVLLSAGVKSQQQAPALLNSKTLLILGGVALAFWFFGKRR